MASSSAPRCVPFVCRRGEQRAPAGPAPGQGCGRSLGRAAGFGGGGIACVFFASLELCSCVELRTSSDDEEAEPLMAESETRSARGGKRTVAAAGKGKRVGFGCCKNIN